MNTPLYARNGKVEIAYETFGEGEPLVFAHGLQGTRKLTRAQLEPLSDRYRIVIFDQRGHGASTPVNDPLSYDPQLMAGDMKAVMDALEIERAIVGGESTGAATATLFTLSQPERVKQLLLTAPAFGDIPNPDRQRLKDLGGAMRRLGMSEFLKAAAVRQREQMGWSPEAITTVGEMIGTHRAESLSVALETISNWQILSDLSVLSNVECPVCIIAWDNDLLHPLALAEKYAAVLPNARLVLFPTLPEIFVHPARIGETYREFLEQGKKGQIHDQ